MSVTISNVPSQEKRRMKMLQRLGGSCWVEKSSIGSICILWKSKDYALHGLLEKTISVKMYNQQFRVFCLQVIYIYIMFFVTLGNVYARDHHSELLHCLIVV